MLLPGFPAAVRFVTHRRERLLGDGTTKSNRTTPGGRDHAGPRGLAELRRRQIDAMDQSRTKLITKQKVNEI